MIEFRDKTAEKYGLDMIEYINEEGVKKGLIHLTMVLLTQIL